MIIRIIDNEAILNDPSLHLTNERYAEVDVPVGDVLSAHFKQVLDFDGNPLDRTIFILDSVIRYVMPISIKEASKLRSSGKVGFDK